jgi:hypothetical protein
MEKSTMPEKAITITAELSEDQAWQLAQFCKRSTFGQFYELTEAHLNEEERRQRAYQMVAGIEAIQRALADQGYDPR